MKQLVMDEAAGQAQLQVYRYAGTEASWGSKPINQQNGISIHEWYQIASFMDGWHPNSKFTVGMGKVGGKSLHAWHLKNEEMIMKSLYSAESEIFHTPLSTPAGVQNM